MCKLGLNIYLLDQDKLQEGEKEVQEGKEVKEMFFSETLVKEASERSSNLEQENY